MSESLVRELENMGLLQEQGVSQWRPGEGEDYPMEGTLETIMFCDFVERGLALPVSEFFYRLLQFLGIQLHHLSLEFFPISTFFNISSSLFLSQMPPIPPSSGDVNWYSVRKPEASTWHMIR